MILAIIIITIIIIILIAIIIVLSYELKIEIENRQHYSRLTNELIKENYKMKKIIYSQRINLKHLNKKLNNKI